MSQRARVSISLLITSLLAAGLLVPGAVFGESANNGGLSKADKKQLDRASGYMRSKNWHKAAEAINSFAASAQDAQTCIYALDSFSKFGGPANKAKRACVERALGLSDSNEELMQISMKARQCEMFDLSKQALDKVVSNAKTPEELTKIAREAHSMAMADLAHTAMLKAYTKVNNIPDALQFARDTHALGLEDLTRKCLKDLIEDQDSVSGLLEIAGKIESIHMNDMLRFALTRALDKAKTVEQMLSVYNAAKHYGEEDIVRVAQYRGRKMVLQKKMKDEAAAAPDAMAEQEKRTKEDMLRNSLQKPSGF